MKSLFFIFTSTLAVLCQGQLVRVPITQADQQNQQFRITATNQDHLTLPFWDDFSTSNGSPDTSKWVDGSDVFINATLGQNPPTYRVATFDGLTNLGLAHNIDSEERGPTDSLTSLPIDLSGISNFNRSTTFLSFYWQAKGNGEIPEEKDSIALFFSRWVIDADQDSSIVWDLKWSQEGGSESVSEKFQQEMFLVDDLGYFHSGFQFKFVSYGSKTGPFDTWHIDYVYLNEDRSISDTFYNDRSLSESPSPLFEPYFEIPSKHFYANPDIVISQQSIMASSLDDEPHTLDYIYTLRIKNYENVLDSTLFNRTGQLIQSLEHLKILGSTSSEINFTLSEKPDSLVVESDFFYITGEGDTNFESPVEVSINDQIKTQYLLQDYYAYDDGSAEFAVAINVDRGQLAVKYDLLQPDTLTHFDIYFPNITPASAGKTITLLVWSELSDNGIRLTQGGHVIEAPSGRNEFTRIKLNQALLVRDSVFIGFQQFTNNYIGIGFDRNNTSAGDKIFTKTTSSNWSQNTSIAGAIMIRPVFGYDSAFANQPLKIPSLEAINIYPNPTSGQLNVDGEYQQIELYTLSGKMMYRATWQLSHNLHFLDEGVYLARIISDDFVKTQKIIIRK